MKCPELKCGVELDPDDSYETDLRMDPRQKLKLRGVCGKCYKKILRRNGVATVQAGAGRSTEGTTSETLQMALAL